MGRYNEELIKAGVMLAGEGLPRPEEGFVVDFDADPPVVTDGPYAEAKELFNGFWIIETSSVEEAKQWARKCPLGPGVKLEVRRVTETEEFDRTTRGSRRRSSGRPTWPRRPRRAARGRRRPLIRTWRGSADGSAPPLVSVGVLVRSRQIGAALATNSVTRSNLKP